jgi:predicted TIM-barrel fold metal-dependent hydrolase
MTVDVHVHVIPALNGFRNEMILYGVPYGKAYRSRRGNWRTGWDRGPYRLMPPSFESSTVSPEVLLEYLEWAEVNKAVLMQSAMYGQFNEYLAGVSKKYSDKFVAFAFVDPRAGDKAIEELEYVAQLGLIGIKLEPPDMPFLIDDPKHEAFFRRASELGLIISIDLGWNPSDDVYNFQIDGFEHLARQLPEAKLVLVHLGVSYLWDLAQTYPYPHLQRSLQLAKYPNVWFELAGLEEFSPGEEYPYPRSRDILKVTVDTIGVDRLMWGSDFPGSLTLSTYKQSVNLIPRNCDFLSKEEKAKIMGGNALAFFPFR